MDDFDDRYLRSLEKEPSYSFRHRPVQLDARGTVKQQFAPPLPFCSDAEHDAGWDTMRRDGVAALALDYVLDHRTCMKCKGSFSRKVETSGEEAIRHLRESGLL